MEAKSWKIEVLEEIFYWGEENLTREEVRKLFLATDHEGRPAFHVAAE
jgi:hypothetical protein